MQGQQGQAQLLLLLHCSLLGLPLASVLLEEELALEQLAWEGQVPLQAQRQQGLQLPQKMLGQQQLQGALVLRAWGRVALVQQQEQQALRLLRG